MSDWEPKLKGYPHFDGMMSKAAALALATSSKAVEKHTFYPFIRFHQRWTRFAKKGESGKAKERPIRYAARADAFIFSYYRHLLAAKYECRLAAAGLEQNVLAYRRLLETNGRGKCNIHFARDAFEKIRDLGHCCAIALDISSFFETLDHQLLQRRWADCLGASRLPDDHFKVFRAVTAYAVVDRDKLYERLGYWGVKGHTKAGKPIIGYTVRPETIPRQLCTGTEFRKRIAGGDGNPSLVRLNRKPFGIPQGSPISDLLANIYLFEFDKRVAARVHDLGGTYYRYSDDILIIAPIDAPAAADLESWVRSQIAKHGPKLRIKPEKCAAYRYTRVGAGSDQTWVRLSGEQGANGLEYLGFRYDGRRVLIRDSTISNFQRKVVRSAQRTAIGLVKRYPGKTPAQIMAMFPMEEFVAHFGRVEEFEEKAHDVRNWTFWTYVRRSSVILDGLGSSIFRQMRKQRRFVTETLEQAVIRAFN